MPRLSPAALSVTELFELVNEVGLDDASLVGAPPEMVSGELQDLRRAVGTDFRTLIKFNPEDLSVVGFNDQAEAATSEPPLTTVAVPRVCSIPSRVAGRSRWKRCALVARSRQSISIRSRGSS